VNIDAVIAALGGRYDADEAEVIERVLRDHVILFRGGITES
jgi:hypothetical protein